MLVASAGAGAQQADYPNRLINIVTPFAPGGTDLAVRHYTNSISAEFPQWGFVYDYRQGAQGPSSRNTWTCSATAGPGRPSAWG